MKLLLKNIEIKNIDGESKRIISMDQNFFVTIGEVDEKVDKSTSNALGKTMLLSIILYTLGGNKVPKALIKMKNFKVVLKLEISQKTFIISRVIGDINLLINNIPMDFQTSRNFLKINRFSIAYLFNLEARSEVLKSNRNLSFLTVLNFLDLINCYHLSKDYIDNFEKKEEVTKLKNSLESKFKESDPNLVKIEIAKIENDLENVKNLNISEINKITENLKINISKLEQERLYLETEIIDNKCLIDDIEKYLKDSDEVNEEELLVFLKEADEEMGNKIVNSIEHIVKYHRIKYQERTKMSLQQKQNLLNKNKKLEEKLLYLNADYNLIYRKFENNTHLEQLFSLQSTLNNKLSQLKIENSWVVEIKRYEEEALLTAKKAEILANLKQDFLEEIKNKFLIYSREFIQNLYSEKYELDYLNIEVIKPNMLNKSKIPISFVFKLKRDDSEGVGAVRNIIFDIMLFKFSKKISFMIWDSSCFNEIDPEQTYRLVCEILNISKNENKQAILCINKYQLGEYYQEFLNKLNDNQKIIFNDNNTLLNEDL